MGLLRIFGSMYKEEYIMKNEWIDVNKELPPINVLVKVLLTNGVEKLDFVNEPIDKDMPFQHYIVSKWRMATRDELIQFMLKANTQSNWIYKNV